MVKDDLVYDRRTDVRTDICECRVAFATEKRLALVIRVNRQENIYVSLKCRENDFIFLNAIR